MGMVPSITASRAGLFQRLQINSREGTESVDPFRAAVKMCASIPKAAFAYFAFVFVAGFILGTVRAFYAVPRFGELPATLAELPIMLSASWIVCKRAMARWQIPPAPAPRLAVGALAFLFLLSAEFALGAFGFGQNLNEVLDRYRQPGPLLGLICQILFALLPQIQAMRTRGRQPAG